MQKRTILLPLIIGVFVCASCSNGTNADKSSDSVYNSSPEGPAPGNSSATNPSLADTTEYIDTVVH